MDHNLAQFTEPGINQIIFLADIHLGAHSANMTVLQDTKDYFDKFFVPFVKLQQKNGNKPCVVIAGDFFDNRQSTDTNVIKTAIEIMESLTSVCDVYMMIGNHDIYKKSATDVTPIVMFKYMLHVHIIYDIASLEIKDEKKFLLVSWVGDMKEENNIISENKNDYDYIVLHTELSGMSYDNNRPIINGINLDVVDDKCRILSGHIHKRQESKKGMYFGSPYHLTRSDIGNKKGVYSFTVEDGVVKKCFVENNFSPEYRTAKFSEYGRNPENWKEVIHNNYVDIVFTEEDLDIINIHKFMDELQKFEPKKIEATIERKIINVHQDVASVDENGEKKTLNPNATIEDIFEMKLESCEDLTKEEKESIKKLNKELYNEAIKA